MPSLRQPTLSGGMQLRTNKFLVRPNELILAKNVTGDIIGSWKTRLGSAKTGNTVEAGNNVLSLFGLEQPSDGSDKHLAVINSGGAAVLKYNNSGTWTAISGTSWNASTKVEFAAFLNKAYLVGADSSNNYITTTSLSGTTLTDTSFPKARYPKVFFDRLYLADCEVGGTRYPSRVYYSSIPTSGAITFTTSTDFLEVQTDDGDYLTGLATSFGRLLIFKNYSLYTWNLTSLVQVDDKGTIAHRTIQEFGNRVLYLHYSPTVKGVMLWDGVGSKNISRSIEPILQAVTAANAAAAVSGKLNNHYYLYINDITLDSDTANYYGLPKTHTNVLLDYNAADNQWSVHTLPNDVTAFGAYNNDLYYGDSAGIVYQWASGNSDNGTSIVPEIITHNFYTGQPNDRKEFQGVRINMHTPNGARVFCSIDNGDWLALGECYEPVTYFAINEKGYGIRFKVSGAGTAGPFVFDGLELEYQVEGKVLK